MRNKTLNSNWIYFAIIFVCFLIFYGFIHPLVPFDTDDWMNLTISRPFYPSLKCWNPTKVFPESLEPTVALFAVYFISPVIGDYINALILANATVVSLFISVYLYSIHLFLIDKFRLSKLNSFCLVVFYALLHFLVLKTKETGNDYMWYAEDCNCYYHYIIPHMLSASFMLWLTRHDTKEIKSNLGLFALILVTYFTLFSNLYSSVILIAYIGSTLLYSLFTCPKNENKWLHGYIKQHSYYLIVIALWLIVQLFEVNGIRANSYGDLDKPAGEQILLSMKYLIANKYNTWFVCIVMFSILGAKAFNYFKDNHRLLYIGKFQIIILLAAALSLTYLILLCSKVKPYNMQRGMDIFSFIFFVLLLAILCLGYLYANIRSFKILIPLAILVIAFDLRNISTSLLGVQCMWGTTEYECIENNRNFINQVCRAEALREDSVTIYVPKFDIKDNWPLAFDCSEAIGQTLYKHSVVRKRIITNFELIE